MTELDVVDDIPGEGVPMTDVGVDAESAPEEPVDAYPVQYDDSAEGADADGAPVESVQGSEETYWSEG